MSDEKLAIFDCLLLAIVVGVLCYALLGCSGTARGDGTTPEATAPGQPLDAITYEAPLWADASTLWADATTCLRVTDRASDNTWWLVKMDGQWVCLPIEGR